MMKFYVLILLILFYSSGSAQDQKAYSKGTSILKAGYGIGNVWKKFLEDAYNYPSGTYKVSANGAYTLVYEYGFSNKISAGVALGYSKVTGEFNGFGEHFEETLSNFSIIARSNYHIGSFKKFDPFIGGGIGYYHFKYHNDKPGIINSRVPGSFGFSAHLGTHYYFTPSFGAYTEVGYVAGTFVQLGLALRF